MIGQQCTVLTTSHGPTTIHMGYICTCNRKQAPPYKDTRSRSLRHNASRLYPTFHPQQAFTSLTGYTGVTRRLHRVSVSDRPADRSETGTAADRRQSDLMSERGWDERGTHCGQQRLLFRSPRCWSTCPEAPCTQIIAHSLLEHA